jgi:abortive infection bacteriophage resistance protein
MEFIGMSDISKIISRLPIRDLKPLVQFFNLSPRVIKSWVRSLTVTRNICAHHAISPEKAKELANHARSSSLAEQIMIANYLVAKVCPEMDFHHQVTQLIEKYGNVLIPEQIGFMK